MDHKVGDIVTHISRHDWGPGQVNAVVAPGKLRVEFQHAGGKLLREEWLRPASPDEAAAFKVGPRIRHPQPTGSKRRPVSGVRSIEAYRTVFLERFPGGFSDPSYVEAERAYKVHAHERLSRTLSRRIFSTMLGKRRYDDICARALAVVGATNLIFPNEQMDLRDGLRSADGRLVFAEGLHGLLHGDERPAARVESFGRVLDKVGACHWTVASYFQFLADPATQMFLKPIATRRVAAACGVELNYRPEPNVLTYESLLRVADRLRQELPQLGPKDHIDIQSFIWIVARQAAP